MKAWFAAAIALAGLLVVAALLQHTAHGAPRTGRTPAQRLAVSPESPQSAPEQPAGAAGANYDEARVPAYTLPDPLMLLNGKEVTDARTWTRRRRPELLKLFETHVYGRAPVGRPKAMTWEVASEERDAMGGRAIAKT